MTVKNIVPAHPKFTTGTLNGMGLFDQLMNTVKLHLEEEYSHQRIKGTDYSKVYLGSMEAALANTTQYLIGSALIEEQKLKIQAELKLAEMEMEKIRYEIDYLIPLQREQLEAQNRKIDSEIKLVDAQVLKIHKEIELFPMQERKLQLEIDKFEEEIPLIQAQVQGQLINNQIAGKEILIKQYTYEFVLPISVEKSQAEVNLLSQKRISELGQVDTTVIKGGMMGKQLELYEAQKSGFYRQAETAAAKVWTDVFSVMRSTNEDLAGYSTFNETSTNKVLKKLAEGIDVTI